MTINRISSNEAVRRRDLQAIWYSSPARCRERPGRGGQTREVLAKIDALLAEAGSDKDHLLNATIYLKDIGSGLRR
jgi:hypothetical protein